MSDNSTSSKASESWSQYAKYYDPIKIGSIDGTDTDPHDKGIIRAINSDYAPNRHIKGKPECTIFVGRLSSKTTKDTIQEIFSKFGRIRRFRLVRDIVTGNPKGYGFIEYETEQGAEDAYRKANKMSIDGQTIFVDFECERLLKGWKPRRLGGGFGGRRESGQLRFGGRDRPFHKPIKLEMQTKENMARYRRDKPDLRDHYRHDDSKSSDSYEKRRNSRHSDRRRCSSERNYDKEKRRVTSNDRHTVRD